MYICKEKPWQADNFKKYITKQVPKNRHLAFPIFKKKDKNRSEWVKFCYYEIPSLPLTMSLIGEISITPLDLLYFLNKILSKIFGKILYPTHCFTLCPSIFMTKVQPPPLQPVDAPVISQNTRASFAVPPNIV